MLERLAMEQGLVRQVESVALTSQSRYRIKRKFWSIFERTFRVFTHDGQLIMLVKHPIFRFREEFTVYEDEGQTRPVLFMKSRQIIAINFSYDIRESKTGELFGTVQNRGLRSLIRDKFLILDKEGAQMGEMKEEGASLLRRFIPLLTSRHSITMNGSLAGSVRQIFRFFTKEFEVVLSPSQVDPRFVLACALLALMSEARREDR